MSFEEDTRVSLLHHVLRGGTQWRHLANTTDRSLRRRWCGLSLPLLKQLLQPTIHSTGTTNATLKKCKQSRQTFGCQTNVPYRCQTTTAPARIVTREIKPTILPRKVRNPAQNYTRNPKLSPSQSACTQTSAALIQDGWRTLCDDVTSRWNAAAENQGCARLNEWRLKNWNGLRKIFD